MAVVNFKHIRIMEKFGEMQCMDILKLNFPLQTCKWLFTFTLTLFVAYLYKEEIQRKQIQGKQKVVADHWCHAAGQCANYEE